MKTRSCEQFRARLEGALAQGRPPADVGWHEHLLACADCRAFLEQEESLEELLAALQEPSAPDELAARVLSALAGSRTGGAAETESSRAERRLDAWLEQVPAPRAPRGLARRVLAGLAAERVPQRPVIARRGLLAAAGVALVVAGGLWIGLRRAPRPEREILTQTRPFGSARAGSAPGLEGDEELVSYALENWDLVTSEDLDLWLGGLDPLDQVLIEFSGEDEVPEGPPPRTPPDPRG